jgi:chromosome segregation ATPase
VAVLFWAACTDLHIAATRLLKGVCSVQAQKDQALEATKHLSQEVKSAMAAEQSAAVRLRHMEVQLAARVEELEVLRQHAAAAMKDADEWRGKSVAMSTQLEASDRALDGIRARCKVLERQVQQRDEEMGTVKQQLAELDDCRCGFEGFWLLGINHLRDV